jgi:glycosyltransferase involved in cell wall biosynthesis
MGALLAPVVRASADRMMARRLPDCGCQPRARLPAGVPGRLFGPRLAGVITLLSNNLAIGAVLIERLGSTTGASAPVFRGRGAMTLLGITVAICTHNGAPRLPVTLTHLARQVVPSGLPWEVLVIDNASTDRSAAVAREMWPVDAPTSMRIIAEPLLGLGNARRRALSEARFPLVNFVDDDNWVQPTWVKSVSAIMSTNVEVGAMGVATEAAFECRPPLWFDRHSGWFAVGDQGDVVGDVTWQRDGLWGAGLCVRRAAWDGLVQRGFRPKLTDRRGTQLTTGGDSELVLALRLAGWKLWYDPTIRLRHHMPARRLTWSYMRRLMRANGAASPLLSAYIEPNISFRGTHIPLQSRWWWQVQGLCRMLWLSRSGARRILLGYRAEDDRSLTFEYRVGKLAELLRLRGRYHDALVEVRQAPWRASSMQTAKT